MKLNMEMYMQTSASQYKQFLRFSHFDFQSMDPWVGLNGSGQV